MGTLLQDGIDAAKSGRMEEALQLLRQSAEENSQNADVWVWLSAIIDDEEKQTEFLQKALEIDPENKPAQRGMAFLKRKKFIAPKPGETLSDHTRPIGVFKTGAEKPKVQEPIVPIVTEDNQEPVGSVIEMKENYDPDTENTIPPDSTEAVIPEALIVQDETDEPISVEVSTELEGTPPAEELPALEEPLGTMGEEPEQDAADVLATDQATQVSAVLATTSQNGVQESDEEVEPELDQELQVASGETVEAAEAISEEKVEEKVSEHPLIAEAKRLKWQLLLYGLILTAFVVIGILVGSTLKNLISPQKPSLSMNIEPIAKQNGVFLLEGQEFRRLNILKEFPKEDAGLVITELGVPQIILKDQMVTETSKLKLLDANQGLIGNQVKLLDSKIPVLEPGSNLLAGRYCISYLLGTNDNQAMYWCFVKK